MNLQIKILTYMKKIRADIDSKSLNIFTYMTVGQTFKHIAFGMSLERSEVTISILNRIRSYLIRH